MELSLEPFARPSAIALAAGWGLVVAWCIGSLSLPFGWDHGMMASVGDVILRGGMPYRDGWDVKGPLAFCLFALAEAVFGRHMWAIRLLDLALLLPTLLVLARAAGRVANATVGQWVAIAFALWFASLGWFFTAQPDGWAAMFLVLSVGPLLGTAEPPALGKVAIAGLWIGCCIGIKPLYALFLVVPAAALLGQMGKMPLRQLAIAVGLLSAASLVLPVAMVGWFAARGALGPLFEVHILYNLEVHSRIADPSMWGRWGQAWAYLTQEHASTVLPVMLIAPWALWKRQRATALALGSWLAVAVACVFVQGKFWVYHWLPAYPPITLLAGLGLWSLVENEKGSSEGPQLAYSPLLVGFALLASGVFIAQVGYQPGRSVGRFAKLALGRIDLGEYYSRFVEWEYVANDAIEAGHYIAARTRPQDGVVVFGHEATVNFVSGRPSPTRFTYAMPLTVGGDRQTAYRSEYVRTLREKPPTYIVSGLHQRSADKQRMLREFPELSALVAKNYKLEARIGFLDLYRYKPMHAAGAPPGP